MNPQRLRSKPFEFALGCFSIALIILSKLVKTLAEGGRGGGSPTQAQAVFQEAEAMKTFAEKAAAAMRESL